MTGFDLQSPISRRRALALGGGAMASLGAAGGLAAPVRAAVQHANDVKTLNPVPLPIADMLSALGTNDSIYANGVLSGKINRTDLNVTFNPLNVKFTGGFEVFHLAHFQSLEPNIAMVKGVIAVLPSEANGVIDRLLAKNMSPMAFHQHFTDESPQLFHIHFRGLGAPLDLAKDTNYVLGATATPLPYSAPPPSTPLDHKRIASILGGTATVGAGGFVLVTIPRKEQLRVLGYPVAPQLGVETNVQFEPLDAAGTSAAVAPDFSMVASEIDTVFAVQRQNGFLIECLYNQATDETPQLFFSHQIATGDPYDLAFKVRKALDHMNMKFKS
jgi:hypothetical protein